ncbi:MAG: hypothetical protein ACLRMJ_04000 [Alistipes finegoldii]
MQIPSPGQNDGRKHFADTRTTSPPYGAQAGELADSWRRSPPKSWRKSRVNHRSPRRTGSAGWFTTMRRGLPALAAYTGIVFNGRSGGFRRGFHMRRRTNITVPLRTARPLDTIRTYRLEGDAVLPATASRRFSNIGRTN